MRLFLDASETANPIKEYDKISIKLSSVDLCELIVKLPNIKKICETLNNIMVTNSFDVSIDAT